MAKKNLEPGIPKGMNPDDQVTTPYWGAQDGSFFRATRYILPAHGAAPKVSLEDTVTDGKQGGVKKPVDVKHS